MRELAGAAHDLAHHSQSWMSWLHPHLFDACRIAGRLEVDLDLLVANPYPRDLPDLEPLRLATAGLQDWFRGLLSRLGFDPADVQAASLHFRLREDRLGCPAVKATVTARTGRKYTGEVDFIAA